MKITSHHITSVFKLFSLIIFVLFFTLGCMRSDGIQPEPEIETVYALNAAELNTESELPITHTGCGCFMRVLSVTGLPASSTQLWGLVDVTVASGSQGFDMSGDSEDTWLDNFNNPHFLPSDYEELDLPSTGIHTIMMSYFGAGTPSTTNLTIATQVTCVSVNNKGHVALGETYYPVFEWNQGTGDPATPWVYFYGEAYYCEETANM